MTSQRLSPLILLRLSTWVVEKWELLLIGGQDCPLLPAHDFRCRLSLMDPAEKTQQFSSETLATQQAINDLAALRRDIEEVTGATPVVLGSPVRWVDPAFPSHCRFEEQARRFSGAD